MNEELKKAVDKHCENMRPGSSIPHTPEFRDAWEIRVSFEAGVKWAAEQEATWREEFTLGKYDVRHLSNGEVWISKDDGEGMGIPRDNLEAMIDKWWEEYF